MEALPFFKVLSDSLKFSGTRQSLFSYPEFVSDRESETALSQKVMSPLIPFVVTFGIDGGYMEWNVCFKLNCIS